MKLGSPATGLDFLERTQVLTDIWEYLESDHLKFPGVRRLGKTSILKRLVEQGAERGVMAQWIDVSKVETTQQFIDILNLNFPEQGITQFIKQSGQTARDWLKRIKKVNATLPEILGGGGMGLELQDTHANSWLKAALLLQARLNEQPLLILLDEFPVMLQNIIALDNKEAERLLAWLRIWRQGSGSCRFLFTGSIGLQSLLERHGFSLLMNDCMEYPLGPFKQTEARYLWEHFAQEGGWTSEPNSTEHAVARVGWLSPYLICSLLDESMKAARERMQENQTYTNAELSSKKIETKDVDSAYENLLAARSRFHHWEDRLKKSLPEPRLGFCLEMLNHISRKPEGMSLRQLSTRLSKREPDEHQRAQLVQDLLASLCDEGYTSPPDAKQRVQFRSFLLRDWWNRNHV